MSKVYTRGTSVLFPCDVEHGLGHVRGRIEFCTA